MIKSCGLETTEHSFLFDLERNKVNIIYRFTHGLLRKKYILRNKPIFLHLSKVCWINVRNLLLKVLISVNLFIFYTSLIYQGFIRVFESVHTL